MTIAELVDQHRIVVTVGSGGVGKTTLAASCSLYGAMKGRRAMVLTIDPALRLAQSLGLASLKPGGELISSEVIEAAGLHLEGTLSAGMLDQKSAWDEFIGRQAPNEEVRREILDNHFYKQLSQSFAGSAEYMAVEELCRIDESGDYDLIVLDTPPTGHALDFLEAPRRLQEFLDRSVVGWFVKPYVSAGWTAWKSATRGARFLVKQVEEATGTSALGDISEFFVAMELLFDGIAERSRKVQELLRGPETALVLVAGPEEQVLGEAEELTGKMRALGVELKGVVMNRVHAPPAGCEECEEEAHAEATVQAAAAMLDRGGVDAAVRDWLIETYRMACAVAAGEVVRREAFEEGLEEGVVTASVPEMSHDVHDLAHLAELAAYLSR